MDGNRRRSILLVDDEPRICETISILLNEGGYDVATAGHGLDGLKKLKFAAPDLIVSDLNMPDMSGFEFLSVLRVRFPKIPVIAMSGIGGDDHHLPDGVIADAFYGKGRCRPDELLDMVAHLIHSPAARAANHISRRELVQEPWYRNVPGGSTSMLLVCPDCLRDVSVKFIDKGRQEFREMQCPSCVNMIRYVCGPSLAAILERLYTNTLIGSHSAIEPASSDAARQRPSYAAPRVAARYGF
jgi:CheY-like chemotaxis protein